MTAKERILEAAMNLFSEKGFSKVSVAAICKEAESSKGGFYHHFQSKEELVETIVIDFVKDLYTEFDKLVNDTTINVNTAISDVVEKVNAYKTAQMPKWPGLQKMLTFDGNHIILNKMVEEFNRVTTDTYYQLIERGIKEGIYKTVYPKQVAELFTREIMNLYGKITAVLMSRDDKLKQELYDSAAFTENFLNYQLGLKDNNIIIQSKIETYVEYALTNMPPLKGVPND